ncbi:3'-phosphoesterase [Microgenomates bacterium DG_75]|nr:MAG: 3'-phosphoesterase [Microgenomates bacterium DG_75]
MSLASYQKKRKFAKTPEPKGKIGKGRKEQIFVVHEHWAKHHHYDFRLQIAGVLKSWAVPKGPPQKVGEKRLAVQVEDHPLEYGSFEGVIPEGQYGAGKVEIWDKGKLEIKEKTANSIKFILQGKKLKGEFSIFHPPTFEKKNWLLVKK